MQCFLFAVEEKLGIRGHVLLSQLARFVPTEFQKYRHQYIADVLNAAGLLTSDPCEVEALLGQASTDHSWGSPPPELLWKTTLETGVPHTMFLAPPVETCLQCSSALSIHNKPTVVICYTGGGPLPAMKITLRCRCCGTNYRYDQYGSEMLGGYRYYADHVRPFVRASQSCYVERLCYHNWCALG